MLKNSLVAERSFSETTESVELHMLNVVIDFGQLFLAGNYAKLEAVFHKLCEWGRNDGVREAFLCWKCLVLRCVTGALASFQPRRCTRRVVSNAEASCPDKPAAQPDFAVV